MSFYETPLLLFFWASTDASSSDKLELKWLEMQVGRILTSHPTLTKEKGKVVISVPNRSPTNNEGQEDAENVILLPSSVGILISYANMHPPFVFITSHASSYFF